MKMKLGDADASSSLACLTIVHSSPLLADFSQWESGMITLLLGFSRPFRMLDLRYKVGEAYNA